MNVLTVSWSRGVISLATLWSISAPRLCCQQKHLRLVESEAWTVPETFPVSGVAASPRGEIVLWARTVAGLVVLDSALHRARNVPLPFSSGPVAASAGEGDALEVVVDDPPGVIYLDRSGAIDSTHALHIHGTLRAATKTSSGWWVVATDSIRGTSLSRYPARRASEPEVTSSLDSSFGLLSPLATGVCVTEQHRPFRTRVYATDGRRAGDFGPPLALVDSLAGTVDQSEARARASWQSLPTLPLDSGYLQTLTDLTSDRRIVVVYEANGDGLSARMVRAPLGFSASEPERHVLVASRRSNYLEILQYRWRWRAPS